MIRYIRDIFQSARPAGRPVISLEFFPPKSDEAERTLLERTIPALEGVEPDFCSVTYGAGGSTREKTLGIVDAIQREHRLTAMAHLTCVNATTEQTYALLDEARAKGVKNILALRGDPPNGNGNGNGNGASHTANGDFEYSYQLVRCIREFESFSIGVAGFPEGHVACREGKHEDWRRLKKKIDEGADFVLTQLFFDNRHYFECREFLARQGVTVPIVPGILPILSSAQIKRFVTLCGAELPKAMLAELEKHGEDDEAVTAFGIEYATRQCEELLREDAPGLHFYTLNRSKSTAAVVRNLGTASRRRRVDALSSAPTDLRELPVSRH